MKPIKIFILVTVFIFVTENATAQNLGVVAGVNLSTVKMYDVYRNDFGAPKSKTGFHGGIVLELPIKKIIAIETGLSITTKGYRIKEEWDTYGSDYYIRNRYTTINLEIPLLIKKEWAIKQMNMFVLAGPTLGVGLFGIERRSMETDFGSESGTDNIEWGSEDGDQFKRLDIGIKVGMGVRYKKFNAGLSYTHGISDISNGIKTQNRVYSLSVGYWFSKMGNVDPQK